MSWTRMKRGEKTRGARMTTVGMRTSTCTLHHTRPHHLPNPRQTNSSTPDHAVRGGARSSMIDRGGGVGHQSTREATQGFINDRDVLDVRSAAPNDSELNASDGEADDRRDTITMVDDSREPMEADEDDREVLDEEIEEFGYDGTDEIKDNGDVPMEMRTMERTSVAKRTLLTMNLAPRMERTMMLMSTKAVGSCDRRIN
ncbi:hypothetical protein BDN67DRAFT_72647 [Paxillus ammoniavirescens]|nr:hypothetical protein BDN67DRAFT_72647 [Paxillus ammoniavirescens]